MKNYELSIVDYHKNTFRVQVDPVDHSASTLMLSVNMPDLSFLADVAEENRGSVVRRKIADMMHKTIQQKWNLAEEDFSSIFGERESFTEEPVIPEPEGPNVVYRKK